MIGKVVSHYKILEKLGEGGMGVVYKAEDTKLKRTVALKFPPPSLTTDPDAKERFIHEAQAASALDHPNICNIYEINETDDGQMYMAMACYEGETLKKKIERGPLPIDQAADIALQVAQGLSRAHEAGIIHRDIKPANIMVTNRGEVKIVDFGLAKLSGRTLLAKTGTTFGTAAYMSPEQALGEGVDHRTDIWSLGVVLYEVLTGQRPFESNYEQVLIYSILSDNPKAIKDIRPDVPEALEKITRKAMAKEPKDRYQTVTELVADLETFKPGTQPLKQTRRHVAKRKALLYGGIAAGLVIAVAGTVIFFSPARSPAIRSLAVLPFVNAANNPELDYYCDGLTEALTNQISALPQLQTITSFNGVLDLKGKDISIAEIGNRLNVETILVTRLFQHGDSLVLNMELVDARENRHLWGRRFEEGIAHVNRIPQAVFLSLAEDLHAGDVPVQPKSGSDVSEAYRLYLQARSNYHKRHIKDFRLALEFYQRAIALDPSFVLAHSGLAESYVQLAPDEFPWVEVRDSAMSAAATAVELDKQCAQAYAARGLVKLIEADLKGAEQDLLKALALNPLYSEAYHYYAHVLHSRRDFDRAVEKMQRAVDLAPYSVFNRVCLGYTYQHGNRWNEAVRTLERARDMDSSFAYTLYLCQWEFSLERKQFDKAKEYARLASGTPSAPPWELERMLTRTEALMGKRAEALRHLERVRDLTRNIQGIQRHEIDLTVLAPLYAQLNFKSEAIDLVESAFAQHAYFIWLINNVREFDILQDDPRFRAVLGRGGFID